MLHEVALWRPGSGDSIKNIVNDKDVFKIPPTVFGKSLIFQLFPSVMSLMNVKDGAMMNTPKLCRNLPILWPKHSRDCNTAKCYKNKIWQSALNLQYYTEYCWFEVPPTLCFSVCWLASASIHNALNTCLLYALHA